MRSLFLRIFIWFWATISAVGLVLVILTAIGHTSPFRGLWRQQIGNALVLYGQLAVELWEQGKSKALSSYLDRVEKITGSRIYLFDSRGRSISTAPPREIANLVSEIKAGVGPQFRIENDKLFVASSLAGAKGTQYLIVEQLPRNLLAFLVANREALLDAVFRLALVVVIVGVLSYWLVLYLTRPLVEVRSAVRRFADGDMEVRIRDSLVSRKDEIGDLARDFDFMVKRIRALMSAQRQLLRDISHELRSPLARLTVALELARWGTTLSTQQFLNRIERESIRLNDLIAQLLDLSRLQSGVEGVKKESLDLTALVVEVASDADYEARTRECSVKVEAGGRILVEGDRELLRRAVENVLRNAIHYTRDNTAVEVSVQKVKVGRGWEAIVQVRDHGPGVPDSALKEIFLPFRRTTDKGNSGGTGLGLAIVEQAVLLHRGCVRAVNAEDGGLTVEIRLPAM